MYQEFDLPYQLYLDRAGRVQSQSRAVAVIEIGGRRVTVGAAARIRAGGVVRSDQANLRIHDPGDPPVGVHRA